MLPFASSRRLNVSHNDSSAVSSTERSSFGWMITSTPSLQRQHPGPLDFDSRGKYYRRLLNRGFTHDQAMDALNAL